MRRADPSFKSGQMLRLASSTRAGILDNRYSIEVCHGISICKLVTWTPLIDDDERRESDAARPMRHLTEYCLRYPPASVEVNE
jgi:hypothetical protein